MALVSSDELIEQNREAFAKFRHPAIRGVEPHLDSALNRLVEEKLRSLDLANGVILDGYPASKEQGDSPTQDSGAVPGPSEMRWIRLTLRVQPLHLIEFLGRDLRQVPDEQNQAPGLRDGVRSAEGWHAAQTNPIFNCVVELAIALVLRPGCAQVGRFRDRGPCRIPCGPLRHSNGTGSNGRRNAPCLPECSPLKA